MKTGVNRCEVAARLCNPYLGSWAPNGNTLFAPRDPQVLPWGTVDECAKQWQIWLNDEYNAGLQVDGVFGPKAQQWTVRFQRDHTKCSGPRMGL